MNRLLKLKRTWTAAEADEWTKEDVVAAALAVVCFVAVSFGTPYSCSGRWASCCWAAGSSRAWSCSG